MRRLQPLITIVNTPVQYRGPPSGFGEQGKRAFISGEQGNKGQILRGTKKIVGNREHKKTNFRFLRNRGTRQFISGKQGNMYPTGRASIYDDLIGIYNYIGCGYSLEPPHCNEAVLTRLHN